MGSGMRDGSGSEEGGVRGAQGDHDTGHVGTGGVVAVVVGWWQGTSEAPLHTPLEQGCLGPRLVVVPRRRQFSQLVVGGGVVGVGLVGALGALLEVVGAVVVVRSDSLQGWWWETRSCCWWECNTLSIFEDCVFLSLNSPLIFNYYDFHFSCFISLHCVAPIWWEGQASLLSLLHKSYH